MITLTMRPRTSIWLGLSATELKDILKTMLRALECPGLSLDVLITGDREIEAYNRQFLKVTGPTNVLSFPAEQGRKEQLGSICLCAEAVYREAVLYGQDGFEHLVRLLTHAILHVLGMEHGLAMEEQTEWIVDRLRHSRSTGAQA